MFWRDYAQMQHEAMMNEQRTMNEVLHLLMGNVLQRGCLGGWPNCQTTDRSSTPESHPWLDLGDKNTCVIGYFGEKKSRKVKTMITVFSEHAVLWVDAAQ